MRLFSRKSAPIEAKPVPAIYGAVERSRQFSFMAEPITYITVVNAVNEEVMLPSDRGPRAAIFTTMDDAERFADSLNERAARS